MGANPLVYILFCSFLGLARGDTGPSCQPNCCAGDEFCCGSFCIPTGSREAFTCVSVPNGCCTALNRCAPADTPESDTTPTPSNDVVSSDSTPPTPRSSSDSVTSDEDPVSNAAASPPPTTGAPCNPDCCVSGTFCCGRKCRRETLRGSLFCPLTPTCCSNPRNICSDGSNETPPTPAAGPQVAPPAAAASPLAASPGQADVAPSPTASSNADGAPTQTPAGIAPAPTQTLVCDDGCEAWWAQCGGEGYTGPGCCTEGSSCEATTDTFEQCLPDNNSPLCSSGPPEPAGAFCQCGGSSFLGLPECGPGLACIALNVFYSQCRPLCSARTDSRRERRDRDIM